MNNQLKVLYPAVSILAGLAITVQLSSAAFGLDYRKPSETKRRPTAVKALADGERSRAAFDAYSAIKRPIDPYDIGRPPAQPAQW